MTDDISRSPDGPQPAPAAKGPETLSHRLRAILRAALGMRGNGSARAEIEDALAADEAEGAAFSPEERAMLRAILKLGDMRVDDVMVPRADIEAVEIGSSVATLIGRFQQSGHSRMPVFRETLDDTIGMVHIKDLMGWIAETALAGPDEKPGGDEPPRFDLSTVDLGRSLTETSLVRPILFVPPSMPARMLLQKMQASRTQMALVIDEYGGTDGLVSLEDLVEIIVGEIEDEHDLAEEVTIAKVSEGQYIADARASIEEAQAVIGPNFAAGEQAEDVETVGGLIFQTIGRVPVRGEIVHAVEGFEFEVLDADPRRIKRIRISERRKSKALQRQARPRPSAAGPGPERTTSGTSA